MAPGEVLLSVEDLDAGYGPLTILRGIELSAARGEVIGIFGRNGAGKSTLLESIGGLLKPSRGHVRLDGRDLTHRPAHVVAREGIALVPQWCGLFPGLDTESNIRLACRGTGKSHTEVNERVEQTFERFASLAARRDVKAGALSGGEQRILAIAKALVRDPVVLLLDEPSIGLAPIVVDQVAEVIHGLRGEDHVILIAEQRVDWALDAVDRGVVIDGGEITQVLTPETRLDWLSSIERLLGLTLPDPTAEPNI